MDPKGPQRAQEKTDEVVLANPFRCRMWALHDRIEDYLTEESCRAEIESFERHGQVVPVLGRSLRADPAHDIELIYGARRLFIARHLNSPLQVRVREVSDREALIAMDAENRQRKDISPYERGVSYSRWLRTGHFKSQEDIARALHVSASQVSRLLRLARLPSVVLNAFASPLEILEVWGLQLAEMCEVPERREVLFRRARSLSHQTPRPPSRVVFEHIRADVNRVPRRRSAQLAEVVLGQDGRPLFRVKRMRSAIVLSLPTTTWAVTSLEDVKRGLIDVLQRASTQVLERSRISAAAESAAGTWPNRALESGLGVCSGNGAEAPMMDIVIR